MRINRVYFVYILTNPSKTTLYVGYTSDLLKRVHQHKTGYYESFAKRYNITKLVYYETFNDAKLAFSRERQIKKYRRSKKEALIEIDNPKWEEIIAPISN
ncbi:GIY-YIG nuclease family protein [Brumimicrobium aurantiacum]|uniref:GIY-YIG nuclease family protein n=1 Tax=Brumimicrobium aurantiacum TaxID=1737063 RepID=A0A3E1F1Q0_9FLAO|nr:GIY-YIG nuclease family protein [Brumimicrobium aurantiacum]RFC55752.1 GIY-YIG nuclease family protein [Brumimicrobium aurantiacum]